MSVCLCVMYVRTYVIEVCMYFWCVCEYCVIAIFGMLCLLCMLKMYVKLFNECLLCMLVMYVMYVCVVRYVCILCYVEPTCFVNMYVKMCDGYVCMCVLICVCRYAV